MTLVTWGECRALLAKERMDGAEGVECVDWFFCTKELSADAVEEKLTS